MGGGNEPVAQPCLPMRADPRLPHRPHRSPPRRNAAGFSGDHHPRWSPAPRWRPPSRLLRRTPHVRPRDPARVPIRGATVAVVDLPSCPLHQRPRRGREPPPRTSGSDNRKITIAPPPGRLGPSRPDQQRPHTCSERTVGAVRQVLRPAHGGIRETNSPSSPVPVGSIRLNRDLREPGGLRIRICVERSLGAPTRPETTAVHLMAVGRLLNPIGTVRYPAGMKRSWPT